MTRIVLVETSHPGNIGASARAMKTMGLNELYLVKPKLFPDEKATAMAAHATDILEKTVVVDSLTQALIDCQVVFGVSARARTLSWPILTARAAAEKIRSDHAQHKVALLFGREHSGLTNEELQLCQYQIQIPANPDYSSLNLASAVQIISYELCLATTLAVEANPLTELATMQEVEGFYSHLEQLLTEIEFIKPLQRSQVINRLRRLFSRTLLEQDEINILRGIFSALLRKRNL